MGDPNTKITIDSIIGHNPYVRTNNEFDDVSIILRAADINPAPVFWGGSAVTKEELTALAKQVDTDGDVSSFSRNEVTEVIRSSIQSLKEKLRVYTLPSLPSLVSVMPQADTDPFDAILLPLPADYAQNSDDVSSPDVASLQKQLKKLNDLLQMRVSPARIWDFVQQRFVDNPKPKG